jgi:acyl carrier protein
VLALDWVAWKEIGMAVDFGTNGDTAFRALPTATGLSVLDRGLRSGRSRIFAGEVHYHGELVQMLSSYDITLDAGIEVKVAASIEASADRLRHAAQKIRDAVSAVEVELTGRADGAYSEIEYTVARCIAQAFGYPELDVDGDFFDMGGDSIMAASVASAIAVSLDVPFDVADIVTNRTIGDIAYHIEGLRDEQL